MGQHFGEKWVAPKWGRKAKADLGDSDGSSATKACIPTKYHTTMDLVGPL